MNAFSEFLNFSNSAEKHYMTSTNVRPFVIFVVCGRIAHWVQQPTKICPPSLFMSLPVCKYKSERVKLFAAD